MWDLLWITLAAVGLLLYGVLRARERFVIKVGNPFKDQELISFDRNAKGTRVIGFYPDTCPAHKPQLHQGLCYEPCADGYYGAGPTCWAESTNIGPGMFSKLASCPASGYPSSEGWVDMGLFCFKSPRCKTGSGLNALKVWDWECTGGQTAFKKAECPPGGSQAQEYKKIAQLALSSTEGTQRATLSKQVLAPSPNAYSDAVGGMCYKPCPKERPNHAPSAPYLCYKNSPGRGFVYTRGVGDIPPPIIIGEG